MRFLFLNFAVTFVAGTLGQVAAYIIVVHIVEFSESIAHYCSMLLIVHLRQGYGGGLGLRRVCREVCGAGQETGCRRPIQGYVDSGLDKVNYPGVWQAIWLS